MKKKNRLLDSFHRNPRTSAEAREYAYSEEENVHVRPRRNPKNLPNSYDDLPVCRDKIKYLNKDKSGWKRKGRISKQFEKGFIRD